MHISKTGLDQPTHYQIMVIGHLNRDKATWFEGLTLTDEYGEDGTPITTMTGEILDQAMLHGLLAIIRDLGLALIAVLRTSYHPGNTHTPAPPVFTSTACGE